MSWGVQGDNFDAPAKDFSHNLDGLIFQPFVLQI